MMKFNMIKTTNRYNAETMLFETTETKIIDTLTVERWELASKAFYRWINEFFHSNPQFNLKENFKIQKGSLFSDEEITIEMKLCAIS